MSLFLAYTYVGLTIFLSQKLKSKPSCLRDRLGTVSSEIEHAIGNLQENALSSGVQDYLCQ